MRNETQDAQTQSSSVRSKKRRLKVFILGATGSGKTCCLAGLSILSEPNRKSPIHIAPDDPVTAEFLDQMQSTLRHGQWPPPTTKETVLEMSLVYKGAIVDLRVIDYAGESFTGALRKLEHEQIRDLYEFSRDADIYLLLFDPYQDLVVNGSAELEEKLIERQCSHLQAIGQIWKENVREDPRSTPTIELGLVITKSDTIPGLNTPQDAHEYFQKHAPNLVSKLSQYASSVKCFAISVIGNSDSNPNATNRVGPPEKLSPSGYEQLFEWVVAHNQRNLWRKTKKIAGWLALACTFALIGPMVYREMNSASVKSTLSNPGLSDIEQCESISGISWINAKTKADRDAFLSKVLSNYKDQKDQATSSDEFRRLRNKVDRISVCKLGSFAMEFQELATAVQKREREIRYRFLMDESGRNPLPVTLQERCNAFIQEYQTGNDVVEVEKILKGVRISQIESARKRIGAITCGNSNEMKAKAIEIQEFLRAYEKEVGSDEAVAMRKAASLANLASGEGNRPNWTVKLKRSGNLNVADYQSVIISRHRLSDELHRFDGSKISSKTRTWSDASVSIPWKAGDPLSITLRIEGYLKDVDIGYVSNSSPLAISVFAKETRLNVLPGQEGYSRNLYVDFDVVAPNGEQVSESDWDALKSYIWPGGKW